VRWGRTRISIVLMLMQLLVPWTASAENNGNDQRVYFNIQAQRADFALTEFAEQADLTLIFRIVDVRNKSSNRLVGEHTLEKGADILLDGTGLIPSLRDQLVLNISVEARTEPQGKKLKNTRKTGLLAAIGALFVVNTADAQESNSAIANENLEQVVVTGVRGKPRTLSESPIPIDVFSSEQLDSMPQSGLFEAMRYLVPSLNMPQRPGGGTATFISSAGLRGLNPDQTLLLVNGKRRHRTALINTSTGQFSGSAGVDLNMIPRSAIKRIEVLRDGAAAQYGSDAIAGVVNIILNDSAEGGRLTFNRGVNFDRGDGQSVNAGINAGMPLGDDGFLNISFDFMDREFSNRARLVPVPTSPTGSTRLFPLLADGSLDPREETIDRLITTNYGNFPTRTYSSAINAGYEFENFSVYNFTTFTGRDSTLDFTFRRPLQSTAIPEIYPQGFRPTEVISEVDYEVVTGIKGIWDGFEWDASLGYGKDESDWRNTVGLNASLGALSPTSFYLGQLIASELTAQLDVTKSYVLESGGTLQVSFGTQFRREEFEITAGEELSYVDGRNGLPPGAQGFPGFAPEAVNDLSRDNFNAYVELGWDPTEKLFLGFAGRYEDFNDSAGQEIIGKINGRYEITDTIGLRASANTGFRAPSVQQLGFKGSRGQFADLDNDGIAETLVLRQTLPSTDLAAQALGAEALVPETSVNFSVGITFDTDYGLSLTIDLFRLDVDDRVALSTQFNRGDGRASASGGTIGTDISQLLDAAGFDASLGGVNYFTNAIDSRSQGVDVVATYSLDGDFGSIQFSAAYNYTDLSIRSVDANPEELASLVLADGSPIVQFDRARLGTYTDEFPGSKLTFNSIYSNRGYTVNVRGTQFGSYQNVSASAANDTFNDSELIVDLELGYEFDGGLNVYAGANNIFNTYPAEVRPVNRLGQGFYDTNSPYGFTGGSWYLRTSYDW
jgi:iron complex outermembrane receptor protein